MSGIERWFVMLHVKLDPDTEKELAFWAKHKGQSMDDFTLEAIREKIEELEDIALLEEALRDPDAGQRIPHEQMMRELGLDA